MTCDCPVCGNEICDKIVLRAEAGLLLWPTGYIRLSPSESVLLETVLNAYPKRVDREELLMELYVRCHDIDEPPNVRSVRIHMCHLRRKLERANAPLSLPRVTSYSGGYYVEIKGENKRHAA